jgi:hypothetical protein
MSNGTSGDISSISKGSKRYAAFEWMQISGRALAERALRVIDEIEHQRDVSLAMQEAELDFAVRRPDTQRVTWAREVLAQPAAPRGHRWAKVYANETLHLADWPARRSLKLQAIRVGDLAIASIPCEVFAETGLGIKEQSPIDTTFTIELANGYAGYLPPRQQLEWGGYETWPARSSCLEIEAESRIRAAVLDLLQKVAGD